MYQESSGSSIVPLANWRRIGRNDPDRSWLDNLYPIPDPVRSEEEFQAAHHRDLASMDLPGLRRDREQVHLRSLYDANGWLVEREAAISAEISKKERANRPITGIAWGQPSSPAPKPAASRPPVQIRRAGGPR